MSGFDLAKGLASRATLRDGNRMPVLGLGVWQVPAGATTRAAVGTALGLGYRLIDTATLYGNEEDVGAAIRASGVPRDEIFVTTKLWNDDHGFDRALAAFERSARRLGVGTIDLYLIHWPVRDLREESWRALGRLQREGRVRSIGVSNFTVPQLESLARPSDVIPVVDQVELTPFLAQRELVEYAAARTIQIEAYSPLHRGRRLDHPTLLEIAAAHGRTPAQIVLRWNLERGVIPIPKSVRPERQRENASVFDFALRAADRAAIDALDEGDRIGTDPGRFG